MSSEARAVVERVTVLEPKPGDVLMVQLRADATMEQIEEFCQVLSANLPPAFDQVQFIGARCFEGVMVVRPEIEIHEVAPPRHLVDCFDPECQGCYPNGRPDDGV